MRKHAVERARTPEAPGHAPTVERQRGPSLNETTLAGLEPLRAVHSLGGLRTHADSPPAPRATLRRQKAAEAKEEKKAEFTITLPQDEELRVFAATLYAEASASSEPTEEMRAIASVIRNRVDHVTSNARDRKWFGDASYASVAGHKSQYKNKKTGEVVEALEFRSFQGPRYQKFLSATFASSGEQKAAQTALDVATDVYTKGAPYAFVFFQKGAASPSNRAEDTPTKLGAHNFWAFKKEDTEEAQPKKKVARQSVAGASTRDVPSQVYETLESPSARPLEPEVRHAMEARLGHDFSRVRVHTDTSADTSARAVEAVAYTVGSHVVFRSGTYQPDTPEGQRLLAHELVHVMQQAGGPDLPQGEISLGDPSSAAEQQAHGIANGLEPGRAGPLPGAHGQVQRDVSFELGSKPQLTPSTNLTLSEDELAVLAWLRAHREAIIRAEQKYRVDRRAIAAAIAWEALENVRPAWKAMRAVGPGKVHYKENFLSEGQPIAKEVEEAGYLPRRTAEERKKEVSTDEGSIEYIAAIMAAIAETAAGRGYDLRKDPAILTNVYQGSTLRGWRERLSKKAEGEPLRAGNPMALWTQKHLAFLEEAVGLPELPEAAEATPEPTESSAELRRQTATETPAAAAKPEAPPPVDPGTVRAQAAERMVQKLKEAGAKYTHETVTRQGKGGKTWEESTRDWESFAFSDCSKFVQWVLEGSGQGSLFGRENAQTEAMRAVIDRLVKDGKSGGLRKEGPHVGDLIMWGGHVAIVTELKDKADGQYIVFAHMGLSGANLIGKGIYSGKLAYWLKVDALPTRKGLASGEFLGYWTP